MINIFLLYGTNLREVKYLLWTNGLMDVLMVLILSFFRVGCEPYISTWGKIMAINNSSGSSIGTLCITYY